MSVAELREVTRAALGHYAHEAWPRVLATVAHAHGLAGRPDDPAGLLRPWAEPGAADHLGAVHESLVPGRAASGTFYTPPALVEWVLDRALDPLLDTLLEVPGVGAVPEVLDPACGSGAFLVAVVRRIARRLGRPAADVVPHVHGTDLDPVAVAITRLLLRLEAPEVDAAHLHVEVADGLTAPVREHDAVVGNPPFLGRMRSRVPASPAPGARRGPAPYTDLSALFLADALARVRPGGRVALVQPLSVLAARDAGPVRDAVRAAGAVTAFWSSATPVFPGTAVLTCVPVVERGTAQGPVEVWLGPAFTRARATTLPPREWGPLAAPAHGVPVVREPPIDAGRLGDLATCTADFRDQYYGLVPHVRECADPDDPAGTPLITSGLIEPAASLWGRRATRFARIRYAAPEVDLDALRSDGALAAWVAARLVPKVLVATQGRVIEAVVDQHGTWLPSVPVVSVVAPPDRLWHVLAVLLAPPVAAAAAARYLGAALTATSVKLSARQLANLPLPPDRAAWDRGADAARAAQTGPDSGRAAALARCAEAMAAAYDEPAATAWWLDRSGIHREFT